MIGVSVLTCVTMIAAPVPEELRPGPGAWVEYKPAPDETLQEVEDHLREVARTIDGGGGIILVLHKKKGMLEVLKERTTADQFWFRDQTMLKVRPKLNRVEIWFKQGSDADRLAISNAIAARYGERDLGSIQRSIAMRVETAMYINPIDMKERYEELTRKIEESMAQGDDARVAALMRSRDSASYQLKRYKWAKTKGTAEAGRWERTKVRVRE